MDIGKVKVDQLTLLACLPDTLSLVSNVELKTPKICTEHFGSVCFLNVCILKSVGPYHVLSIKKLVDNSEHGTLGHAMPI